MIHYNQNMNPKGVFNMSKSKGFFAGVLVTMLAGAAAYAAYKTVKTIEERQMCCAADCEDCDYYDDCYGDDCDCCSDDFMPDEDIAYCDCKTCDKEAEAEEKPEDGKAE